MANETQVAAAQPVIKQPANHVTIFSNGMGYFERIYKIAPKKPTPISIPFKKDSIADALESLSVFGLVRYSLPPSYIPTNSDDTELEIDPQNVSASLLVALSGSKFSCRRGGCGNSQDWNTYTLLGIETLNTISPETKTTVPKQYVSVITDAGHISRISLEDIYEYRFDDQEVQSDIKKAIKSNFEKIKPDSTLITLALTSTTENEEFATITYKVPLAAWKLRYNIRQDDHGTILQIAALVDNCTDDPWNESWVSVVTGNPNSFRSPDLAKVNEPIRQILNVVNNVGQGHTPVEEGMALAARGGGMAKAARSYASPMSFSSTSSSLQQYASGDANLEEYNAPAAESPGMDVKEVGDFAVFKSKELVSIAAKRSAIVPIKDVSLKHVEVVLLYQEVAHSRRPYRALKFINEATNDLGRGKIVFYKDDVFQGEDILELTKPGESRLLKFCLENGVKIVKENKNVKNAVTSLRLTEGFSYEERRYTAKTQYDITNKKEEPFKVLLEHVNQLEEPTIEIIGGKMTEKLANGYRISLELGSKAEVMVTITETRVEEARVAIYNNYGWIVQHVIDPDHALAKDKSVQACMQIQSQIEDLDRDIATEKSKVTSIDKNIDRLHKNLAATKEKTETTDKWIKSVDEATDKIGEIEREVSRLEVDKKQLSSKLAKALKSIHAEWTA